ncbi:MAG: universal stress protein [Bacteroidota bacterium]
MKKILVPTDFSPLANEALRTAYQLAQQHKAAIHLVHVLMFPMTEEEAPPGVVEVLPVEYLKQLKQDTTQQLIELIEKEAIGGVPITSEIVVGNPYQSIARILKKEKMDLVVMGSRGVSGVREILVGSNAERMVRFSPSPVLIIKSATDFSHLKNIVYATALHEKEHAVLRTLSELQLAFDAQLHVVRINTISNFREDPTVREQLKKLAKSCQLKNYTLNTFSDIGEEEGIIHFADEIGADLIAISTHAYRGLLRLLGGSIAENVANHSKYPVWTMSLHPSQE